VDKPWSSTRTWTTEIKRIDGAEEDARKLVYRNWLAAARREVAGDCQERGSWRLPGER
jgi:hypothetical protein